MMGSDRQGIYKLIERLPDFTADMERYVKIVIMPDEILTKVDLEAIKRIVFEYKEK